MADCLCQVCQLCAVAARPGSCQTALLGFVCGLAIDTALGCGKGLQACRSDVLAAVQTFAVAAIGDALQGGAYVLQFLLVTHALGVAHLACG